MKTRKPEMRQETSMAELIASIRTGDQQAFAALYEQTSQEVYRTARAVLRDEEAALDVQQDTYVFAYNHLGQLSDPEKVRPWLRSIAVNRAKSLLRKQTPVLFTELENDEGEGLPEQADLSPEASPELSLERKETAELVNEILADLSDGQRAAVAMYYYEQMSVVEIAEALGVAHGTVKSQLARGKKKIEQAVHALEKKGVKLYGLSPMAFLLALMRRMQPTEAAAQAAAKAIVTKAAADTVAVTAKPVTALTFGQMLKGSVGKLVIGALSIAAIGGGLWAGSKLLKTNQPVAPNQPSETVEAILLNNTVPDTRPDTAEDLTDPTTYLVPVETDAPETAQPTEPEETTAPTESKETTQPTEPTEPALPEDIEAELAALERNLPEGYFTKLTVENRSFFSNGHTRIWDTEGTIVKKNLDSGKVETLFTLDTADNSGAERVEVTELVGVTNNRLYFGTNDAELYDYIGGFNIFSVDYHNQGRTEHSDGLTQDRFQNGWLILEGHHTDVSAVSMRVIDRNNKMVLDVNECWDGKVVDGSFYYIYAPDSPDSEAWDAMSDEKRDEMMANMQYDVCRLDPDGSITKLGSIQWDAWSANFHIDEDAREIVFDDNYYFWDLFTVQAKIKNLAFELPHPEDQIGVGVNLLKNDSQAVMFYCARGLFVYDGTDEKLLFLVDIGKALDCKNDRAMQGDHNLVSIELNEDGSQILLSYPHGLNQTADNFCLINTETQTYTKLSAAPEDFTPGQKYEDSTQTYGETGTFGSLWILHNGESWHPFPAQ